MLVKEIAIVRHNCVAYSTTTNNRWFLHTDNLRCRQNCHQDNSQFQQILSSCYDNAQHWWRHQMETFFALMPPPPPPPPATGEFPLQWPVTRSLMFSLICAWTNSWVNNRAAGDLRRNRAHYDVTTMLISWPPGMTNTHTKRFIRRYAWTANYKYSLWPQNSQKSTASRVVDPRKNAYVRLFQISQLMRLHVYKITTGICDIHICVHHILFKRSIFRLVKQKQSLFTWIQYVLDNVTLT